jgi:putrescine transport system ATP-binding protein
MLKLVQLGKFAKRKPHQLSGGQQQRVALARSLAKQPQLLLLDEPLGALDKKLREQTQIELVNIIEKVGVTCVMVTHDQEEAMTMASRIAVMSEGRFLQVGAPSRHLRDPGNRFVADFIGNVNLMDGTLDRCDDWPTNVAVAVRPEKVSIAKARPVGVEHNLFAGKVKEISYFGSYNNYIVVTPQGTKVKITEPNGSRHELLDITWEDEVFFWWDNTDAVVLRD